MKQIDILIKKLAELYKIEIIEDSNQHEVVKESGEVITSNEDSFWASFGIPFPEEQTYDFLMKNEEMTEISKESLIFGDVNVDCNPPLIYNNATSSNNIDSGNYQYAMAA